MAEQHAGENSHNPDSHSTQSNADSARRNSASEPGRTSSYQQSVRKKNKGVRDDSVMYRRRPQTSSRAMIKEAVSKEAKKAGGKLKPKPKANSSTINPLAAAGESGSDKISMIAKESSALAAAADAASAAAASIPDPLASTGGVRRRSNPNSPAAKRAAAKSSSRKKQEGTKTAEKKSAAKKPAAKKPVAKKAASTKSKTSNKPAASKKSTASKKGAVKTSKKTTASKAAAKENRSTGLRALDYFSDHVKVLGPIVLLLIVIIGGGLVDGGLNYGKIHTGIHVQGVDVGGLNTEEASAKIKETLTPPLQGSTVAAYASAEGAASDGAVIPEENSEGKAYAADASDLDGDGKNDKWIINADTIGAFVDGDSLAQQAYEIGRSNDLIFGRIRAWFGGSDIKASVSYDKNTFDDLMSKINKSIGTSIKESKVKIESGKATLVNGRDGYLVSEGSFIDTLSQGFFDANAANFVIPMEDVSMHIKPETAQRIVDQVNTSIAKDVKITYEKDNWTLDSEDLGELVRIVILEPGKALQIGNGTQKTVDASKLSEDSQYDTSAGLDADSGWTIQAYVKQDAFDDYLVDLLGKKATGGATSAKFDTSSGKVKIIPSKNGEGPDRAAAEIELQNILFAGDTNRTIALYDTTIRPELTTEDAKAMGIKERLAGWSIPLSGSSSRIKNIQLLCKLINNSIIAPGDTWSFNETTGERTADKGFETAPVIIGGKHEDQLGGGICQVATCVYNAVCYSGLEIVTRTNHDFYISSYDDEGFADATVSWDVPDFAFANDTENSILMTAYADSEGDVNVTLWGTNDGRSVTCDRGKWKAGAKYATIKENDSELPKGTETVEQTGQDGRSINIHYLVKAKDGTVLHDIDFHSVYQAQNEIIKVGTKTSS